MIYDHETVIAHENASTYFQWSPLFSRCSKPSPSAYRGAVWKGGSEILQRWSLPECIMSSGGLSRPPF